MIVDATSGWLGLTERLWGLVSSISSYGKPRALLEKWAFTYPALEVMHGVLEEMNETEEVVSFAVWRPVRIPGCGRCIDAVVETHPDGQRPFRFVPPQSFERPPVRVAPGLVVEFEPPSPDGFVRVPSTVREKVLGTNRYRPLRWLVLDERVLS